MNVLVTGGAGYIGSHVVKALVDAGDAVVTVDDLSEGHREAVTGGEFVHADLGDTASLDGVFSEHPVDAVMHFAAHCYVGESVTDPQKYYRNNVVNFLNLLEVMRRRGVGRIIFSSTAAVYGAPAMTPIDEFQPLNPINPYGYTKLAGENILKDFSAAYGIRFAALRYFNAAGADFSGQLGESHHPETHLIPRVLAAAAGSLGQVELFGTDYPTPDGTCVRDYVHVNDIAAAHVAALHYLSREKANLVANLGNSRGYSVREIVETAARVTGRNIQVLETARRAGDPASLVCDNTRAREYLHWSPQYSSLDQILSSAWKWEQHRRY